jgi:hypothetical protein
MGKYRELVEKLLETNGNAWSIRIGSKEARLWRPDGNGIIVYASAYGRGPQLRVWCPNADLQDRVHDGLLEWGIVEQRERTQQSVTFLLANADGELIPDLCARLDEL